MNCCRIKEFKAMLKQLLSVFLCLSLSVSYAQDQYFDIMGETDSSLVYKTEAVEVSPEEEKQVSEYRYPLGVMQKWYDWKGKVSQKHGINFNINYTTLVFRSTETISAENNPNASSGILDIQAGWTLLNRKKNKNTGTLYFKINSRHNFNGNDKTPPMLHGFYESGYYGLPGLGYHNYTTRFLELNWRQNLLDNRLMFAVGKLDMTNYFNFHILTVPWLHFVGFGSSVSGTVNWVNQGFGGVVSFNPTSELTVTAAAVDSYGDHFEDGDLLDLGRYFTDGKFMSLLEVGYRPKDANRALEQFTVTAWTSSEYTNTSGDLIGQGRGIAFATYWSLMERFTPYVRFGFSNGNGENTFYTRDLQVGCGMSLRNQDALGVSASYNQPKIENSKPQYTAEAYYRYKPVAYLEISPNVQFIQNPALNPNHDNLFYLGIRGRVMI